MKDLKTGEEKEISLEEFLELTRGEDLCIKQVMRNADGSEVSSVLYGEEENDGRLHAMNFFATMNSVIRAAAVMSEELKKKYPNTTKVFRMSNENLDYEVLVDDMDAPLMYIFRFSKEGVHVQSYVRDERRSITGTPTIDQRYSFVNGEISAEVSDIQADYILCFVFGVYEIIRILEDNGVLLQLQEMKNQGCGILVTGDEDVSLKIVKGHERPELPCMLFGGMFAKSADDTVMMRPYVDELFVSNLQEDDDELEQKTLEESLYDFLVNQKEAKSIGDINNQEQFGKIPRRELVRALQSLVSEGIAFRSLREGKAYYFKESTDQEKLNPIKEQIDNLQAVLNGQKPKMNPCEVIKKDEEDDFPPKETVNISDIHITYNEGKEVSCEQYIMRIPDGFEIVQEAGRDFVAYLKNPYMEGEDWSMGGALITILPATETSSTMGKEYCNLDIHSMFHEYTYWSAMRGAMGMLFGDTEFLPIKTETTSGGTVYAGMLDEYLNTHHFYVNLYTGDGYKQIHYQVDNITGNKDDIYKIICQISQGFILKKPLEQIRKLDESSFMNTAISDKKVDEWMQLFDKTDAEYRVLFNGRVSLVETERIKCEHEDNIFSKVLSVKRLKTYLKEFADSIDEILEKAIDFFKYLEEKDIKLAKKVYEKLDKYISDNEFVQITIDEDEYKEYPKKIKEARKVFSNSAVIKFIEKEQEEEKKHRQEEEKQRLQAYNTKRKGVKNVKNMIYAAQSSYFVITTDGNVIAGGTNQSLIQMVSSWKNIIQITGGDKHIVGLKEDGTVVAAGDNYFGQCDVSSWRDIVSIAAGYNHTVGLKKDGTVVAVGNNDTYYNYYKQSSKGCCSVGDWKDITAIAAGSGSTVGLKKDGKVIVVGDCCKPSVDYSNNEYKANNIENWPPVVEIAAHDAYVYGITGEGNLVTTAIHIRGEKWKNIISIFAPFNGNTELIAVREDGSVVGCWRRNEDWEVEFKKYGNVICAVGETAYNDNVNVLCLRMDGTFSGNPSGGFMSALSGLKLFNHPNTIYQERIESVKRMIDRKKDELANTKGLFSGGKKRTLQEEISQLEDKLDKLNVKVDASTD